MAVEAEVELGLDDDGWHFFDMVGVALFGLGYFAWRFGGL